MTMQAFAIPEIEEKPETFAHKFFNDFDPRLHSAAEFGLVVSEPTVLIVEDEFIIRDLLVEVLRDRGFITLEADDAETAKMMLNDSSVRIDILVSDIRLPGADGRDLARDARFTRPELKVLFLSGYASAPRESKIDIATDFMPKPFRLNEVAEHVEALL